MWGRKGEAGVPVCWVMGHLGSNLKEGSRSCTGERGNCRKIGFVLCSACNRVWVEVVGGMAGEVPLFPFPFIALLSPEEEGLGFSSTAVTGGAGWSRRAGPAEMRTLRVELGV